MWVVTALLLSEINELVYSRGQSEVAGSPKEPDEVEGSGGHEVDAGRPTDSDLWVHEGPSLQMIQTSLRDWY